AMIDLQKLTAPTIQEFLIQHEDSDLSALILSGNSVAGIPITLLAEQIQSRRKAKNKLPKWYNTSGIVFPPPLSLEQASSEETGKYKADMLAEKGQKLLDLTGGMGIDSSFFAEVMQQVTYVERQPNLVSCFEHNSRLMGIDNCQYIAADGLDYLQQVVKNEYDVIFLDPARRDDQKNKVIALDQCEPDVSQLWQELLEKSPTVMIKLSPMLDITHTIAALGKVSGVHVVAVENECKELLFVLERGFDGEAKIYTINIQKTDKQTFSFNRSEEQAAVAGLGGEGLFLYEPNASVLKSGAFKVTASKMGLLKMHEHTHLYLSDKLVDGFPGKTYCIQKQYVANKKSIKSNLNGLAVSIKSRNYPESATMIRKKYKLRDGNQRYVFFATVRTGVAEQKYVFECVKA
ncbi:MAG: class I SAM-dependent methyltransferase, partial [Bacteroidota bacterium]